MEEVSFETKLRRFLLYSSDGNVYYPGCRLQKSFYEDPNLQKIRTILQNMEKNVVFRIIKWVHTKKLSPHPEMVPFVLTECCRIKEWKAESIKLAESILLEGDEFLLFFKFAFEVPPKLGTGRGIRRFIKNWYDRQQNITLATMVGERPIYRGWRHADLIKLAHVKSDNITKSAIYAYAVGGVPKMKSLYGDSEVARTIVNHLIILDSIKKEQNPDKAISAIEEYIVSLPCINHKLHKNKKVWTALLPKMTVQEIVPKLHLISKYGLLRSQPHRHWDSTFTPILFDRIVSKTNVEFSKISPATICLELHRYQHEPTLKHQTAMKKNRKMKKPPQIYTEYVTALEQSMAMAFENIPQTGLNYTIMIDNYKLQTRKCAYRRFLTPPVAASMLTLILKKAAANVKIVTFQEKTPKILIGSPILDSVASLTKAITAETTSAPITRTILNYINPSNSAHEDTDVFVLLANTVRVDKYLDMVKQHRQKNPRNPKFVFCSLCGLKYSGAIKEDENTIVISGFNDKLFTLINGFSQKLPEPDD